MEDPSREPDRTRPLFCPGDRATCRPDDLCACCRGESRLLTRFRYLHWELTAKAA